MPFSSKSGIINKTIYIKKKCVKSMDKYKKLLSNTVIFAVGTFSSKLLVFLMMPFYTRILTQEEYGTVDLITQTGNLLYPLVTLGIVSGVVRYGLDSTYRKDDVFTTGLKTICLGLAALLVIIPFFSLFNFLDGYLVLVYVFVMMSSFRGLCSQFARAKGYVKLYALDGILSTATNVGFNILFLAVFKMGITGYILATICSDCLSAIFVFTRARLFRYIKFRNVDKATSKSMIRYSVPLIPNNMFWWITNVSDRYLVYFISGAAENGLYAASYKIPTVIVLVSNIFMDAWQVSAVSDMSARARSRFFTKVFHNYCNLIFTACSGLILLAKPLTYILVSEDFYISWKYIPYLIMSMAFSCFVTFLGSVYMVERKSVLSFLTTALGAVINIVFNLILIPKYGALGAAFATFFSYFVVFVVRILDTSRFIKIKIRIPRFILSTVILLAQSVILINEVDLWVLWELLLTVCMIVLNMGEIFRRAIVVFREKDIKKKIGLNK